MLLPYDAFMAVIFVHEHGFARGLKPSHQNALDQRQQAVQHLLIFKVSKIACQENSTMLPLIGDTTSASCGGPTRVRAHTSLGLPGGRLHTLRKTRHKEQSDIRTWAPSARTLRGRCF